MITNSMEYWKPICNRVNPEYNSSGVYLWTDPDTRVQYLICTDTKYRGMGIGITPRFNSDGELCIEGENIE